MLGNGGCDRGSCPKMRPPKNVFSKNLRFADTKERSKIPTPTRDDDDDDQHPPPFTSSLLPPQEGMNCWMATWEPVNRQQSRYHKSKGAHLDCRYDHHNWRSTTMVLPLATLTAHSAIHPSLQAPPPHPSMALTPWMNLPARCTLSVPPREGEGGTPSAAGRR